MADAVAWFNVSRDIIGVYISGADNKVFSPHCTEVDSVVEFYKHAIMQILPDIRDISFLTIAAWPQAYSYFGVGQYAIRNATTEFAGCVTRTVFRPIDNCLYFAGEHTALEHHATLEGAVQAGESAAQQIMNYNSTTNNDSNIEQPACSS